MHVPIIAEIFNILRIALAVLAAAAAAHHSLEASGLLKRSGA